MKSRLIVLALVLPMIGCMPNASREPSPAAAPAKRVEEARRESNVEYSDFRTTHQITENFAQAGLVDVRVRTRSGTVTLCGYVDTESQKQAAEAMAKGVAGVVTVANHITVSKPPINTNKPGGPAQKPCDF